MTRRGYSIAELLVAMVIAGIVGISLSKLIINQSRFVSMEDNHRQARSGARAALAIPMDELRAVTQTGDSSVLIQANSDSFTVRVPFAYGIACAQGPGAKTNIALFPADSATYASATATGYVWRDANTDSLHTVDPVTVTAGTASKCATPQSNPAITVVTATGWPATVVGVTPNFTRDSVGNMHYLYRRIRYAFTTSAQLAGRRALWRAVLPAGSRDELVAPFDTSAHFEYLYGDTLGAIRNPTASQLDSIEGVRFVLVSASVNNAPGGSSPSTFNLTTDILFRNRATQ